MYQKPQEPQSIGGVLDDGFQLFRASFKHIVVLAFVGSLLGQLPTLFMDGAISPTGLPDFASTFGAVTLVAMIISVFLYCAIIARIDAVAHGIDMSMSDALGVGAKRFFPMLLCSILYAIAIMLGIVALIVPGIILSLTLLFGMYAVVTESRGPIDALKYSHSLVWGNWWRTAAIVTVAMIIAIVLALIVGFATGAALIFSPGSTEDVVTSPVLNLIVAPLINALLTPLIYALIMTIFYDLKLRKEGGDLADRIEGLENA